LPYELPPDTNIFLPILVPLRSYRYYQREYNVRDLHAFITRYINDRSARLHLPEVFFKRLLQTASCLLILDGLNEVVSKSERETVKERIVQLARSIYPAAFLLSRPAKPVTRNMPYWATTSAA
jgi:predicted NACHT family NTPase